MENFVVSARKYRPVGFEEVVGQDHITTTLKNAIDNEQLAQAMLFCGPRGVGKTTCARIVARLINNQKSDNPLAENDTFNIYELDAASNSGVDDIRNLIEQVRYPPQQGKYKVYIIDEVHMLSSSAFNAFLKTLEEPPSYAIFILATTEKHKVIPTILSRCQIYDFERIEISDISTQLKMIADKEGIEVEDEALNLIARKADGAMRDALSMFDLIVTFSGKKVSYQVTIDTLHILDYDYYFRMTEALYQENTTPALLLFDEILRKGFDGHDFILGLSGHFRDLLVCKDKETLSLLTVSDTVKVKYKEQAEAIPMSYLLTALNLANQCDIQYKSSKNQRLHVELCLLKMAHLNAAIQLSQAQLSDTTKKSLSTEQQDVKNITSSSSTEKNVQKTIPSTPTKAQSTSAQGHEKTPIHELNSADKFRKPEAKNNSKSNIPGDLNALRAAVKTNIKEEKKHPQEEEKQTTATRTKSYRQEDIAEQWEAFRTERLAKGLDKDALLLKAGFRTDGHKILLQLANEALAPSFERMRFDLLHYLRNAVENDELSLDYEVIQMAKEKMLYTDKEKFDHLKKKYPLLQELQEKLRLDPEF